MKKKISICLLALFIVFTFSVGCFADDADNPPWFPEDLSSFEDFHDANAPKVVDEADIFTDAEEAVLTQKIESIVDDYNKDLVIYTTPTSYNYGSDRKLLAADFYQFNGYGIGNDFNGSVLLICMEPGNRGWYTAACGGCRTYYTEKNINDIDDYIEPDMVDGEYYDAMLKYVEKIDTLYKTGSTLTDSERTTYTIIRLVVALVIGLVVGLIVVLVLSAGMKTIRKAVTADGYMVPGSFNLRKSQDHYLYHHVSRVKRDSNNGGGGGGRSSYSGSFSSSGGRSFSGGGRSF